MNTEEHRFVHLDMLRGLAALGVVVGHARAFAVLEYGMAQPHGIPAQVFYFLTGLGHQSVIAFFALSGFLVGGPALGRILHGESFWPRYMFRRLTRLWIVLIPALLLTLGLDTAGRIVGGRAGYEGSFYHLIHSGPSLNAPSDLSIGTLVGNIAFLQTIAIPTFGSNGPLWSLANEFWYYLIFPLIFVGILGRARALIRTVMGCIGVALAVLLPADMVLLGLIWVAGAVGYHVTRLVDQFGYQLMSPVWFGLSLSIVSGSLIVNRLYPGVPSDLVLGGAFACLLPFLAFAPNLGKTYDNTARPLAEMSYTLYATHFPVLAFIWFVGLAPTRYPLGPAALVLMLSLVVTALVVARALWWLFERNTARIRGSLESWCSAGERWGRERWRKI